MPAIAEKPAPITPADRVAALADKSARTPATRRLYRLSVVSSAERPAPFYDHTVDVGNGCGATFAGRTSSIAPDERGKPETVTTKGNRQFLTDGELVALKTNMRTWFLRWMGPREALRAQRINLAANPGFVENPMTDEPLAPYLLIEGPLSE